MSEAFESCPKCEKLTRVTDQTCIYCGSLTKYAQELQEFKHLFINPRKATNDK